jgi:hypothetical protein
VRRAGRFDCFGDKPAAQNEADTIPSRKQFFAVSIFNCEAIRSGAPAALNSRRGGGFIGARFWKQ